MKISSIPGTNDKTIIVSDMVETTLYSYNTKVAEYDEMNCEMKVFGWFSEETAHHINLFL